MSPTRPIRGKVKLVATWWCMDCEDRGEAVMTMDAANKAAMRHMVEVPGHNTVTNIRPANR